MRVLIFGAGGFIGSNLVSHLSDFPKYKIVAVDTTKKKLDALCPKSKYNFIYGDIQKDTEQLKRLIKESDITIDLVAYANPSIYLLQPLEVVQLNLFDNLRIVDFCRKYKKRLIQFSTCEVYGMTGGSKESFHEDSTNLILGPIAKHRWIYSCAKQLLERIVHAHGLKENFNYTIIRPFNFIGPEIDYLIKNENEGNPRVFSHFMSALLYKRPIKLVDGGKNSRSYTYIKDAAEAIRLVIDNNKNLCYQEIINIGNPKNEVAIRDLAKLMIKIYKEETGETRNVPILKVSSKEFYGPGYQDCDRRIPDIKKIRSLGWQPKYDLETTIRLSMQYYLSLNK